MANTRTCGPLEFVPSPGICPARSPGPLGVNDHGDPSVRALLGDTPGSAGCGDFEPPRYLRVGGVSAAPPSGPDTDSASSGSAAVVGAGVASVARIRVPGTGLFIELSPRNFPASKSTSALFIQDAAGKRVLRLDYGFNKSTGKVDYHWNQKGTFAEFGIPDHTSAGPAGEGLYKAAQVFKYGGRALLVVGIAMDLYSIAVAKKRWRQVVRVASGWAGAAAGAEALGALGAEVGSVEPGLGTAIGGIALGIVGGIAGYAGASWAAGQTYDYVEELYYERLAPSAP